MPEGIGEINCENCYARLVLHSLKTGCGIEVINISARNKSISNFNGGSVGELRIRTSSSEVPVLEQIQEFLEKIGKDRLGVAFDDCIPGLAIRAAEKVKETIIDIK